MAHLIVSGHHEWRQRLPLNDNVLRCIDCGIETAIAARNIPRCALKLEMSNSGWLPEPGYEGVVLSLARS